MLANQARFGFAPYRLSGTVYGVLLNHAPALAALGDAVNAAPYKARPLAPVLYLKPRNTLGAAGSACALPAGIDIRSTPHGDIGFVAHSGVQAATSGPGVVQCAAPTHVKPGIRFRINAGSSAAFASRTRQ